MKRQILIIGVCFIVAGCMTNNVNTEILSKFETVLVNDGVSKQEAVLIAQSELIAKKYDEQYNVTNPKFSTDFELLAMSEDYWFVSFKEIKPSFVATVFAVVIYRDKGNVIFANDYVPGHDWIIEAQILRHQEKLGRIGTNSVFK